MANIDPGLEQVLAAIFGGEIPGDPAEYVVGDTVRCTPIHDINPNLTLVGDLDGATGIVVEDAGIIPAFGERGYIVNVPTVTWEHPDAPADMERTHFAFLESEIEGIDLQLAGV